MDSQNDSMPFAQMIAASRIATIICLSAAILFFNVIGAAASDEQDVPAVEITTNTVKEVESVGEPLPGASISNDTAQVEPLRICIDQAVQTNRLDIWHDRMSSRLIRTVERFDHYFGDDPSDDEENGTLVQIGVGVRFDTEDVASFENDTKVRVELPVLQDRLHLLLNNLTESKDKDVESIADSYKDANPNTALSYIFREYQEIHLSLDAGIKLGGQMDPSLRFRARRNWCFGRWELECRQTVRWFQVEGFSETSEIKWALPFGDSWLFQSNSRMTWEEQYKGITPAQIVAWSRELSSRRAYKIEFAAVWPQTPHPAERDYTVAMGYRQLIHSDWMFIELTPQMEFAEIKDYTPKTSLIILFDFMFGSIE